MATPSHLNLSGHLLELEHDELGRLERREAHHDVDDAAVDVALGRGVLVALDEVRLSRCAALECALPEQIVHEGANVESDLGPEWLVVGLEHDPLEPAKETLLDV